LELELELELELVGYRGKNCRTMRFIIYTLRKILEHAFLRKYDRPNVAPLVQVICCGYAYSVNGRST
jgi:hypothetical protein